MKFPSLNQRTRIALDFGTDVIRMAQASRDAICPSILAADSVGSSIFHADPTAGEAASAADCAVLSKAIRSGGFRGRECAITLPASAFLCDLAELPTVSDREVQEAAAWEAVDRFGIDRDDLVTRTLPLATHSMNGTTAPFLLVAVRKSTALIATDLVAASGLEPVRLEHAALASIRTIWRRERSRAGSGQVAVLHLEQGWSTLAVLNRGGLVAFHSFQIQSGGGSSSPTLSDSIPLADDSQRQDDLAWHPFAEQILNYLRHMERQHPGSWPERLLASGPGAARAGLLDAVQSLCGFPSNLCCPSREFTLGPLAADDGNLFAWSSAMGSLLVDVPTASVALQETMS